MFFKALIKAVIQPQCKYLYGLVIELSTQTHFQTYPDQSTHAVIWKYVTQASESLSIARSAREPDPKSGSERGSRTRRSTLYTYGHVWQYNLNSKACSTAVNKLSVFAAYQDRASDES